MSENRPEKDFKKGGNRVQLRVQEFIKKLRPNSIKTQWRNVRKFIVSAATDKRSSNFSGAGSSKGASGEISDVDNNNRSGRRRKSSLLYPLRCDSIDSDDLNLDGGAGGPAAELRRDSVAIAISDNYNGNTNIGCSKKILPDTVICDGVDNNIANGYSGVKKFSLGKISDDSSIISYFNEHVFPRLNSVAEMDKIIPDVIVEADNDVAPVPIVEKQCEGDSLMLQLDTDVTPRSKSPVTVQEWVDSLPITPTGDVPIREECDLNEEPSLNLSVEEEADVITETDPDTEADQDADLTLGAEAGHLYKPLPSNPVNVTITSCHETSDAGSYCSSVDSLLEARKPDPEEILMSLGFGGSMSTSHETGRIPARFLKPSQLKGVNIEDFIRHQQDLIQTYESGFCGFRGLTGPLHSTPSAIVAKIMEKLRDHNREVTAASISSYPGDFDNLQPLPNKSRNKFSRAAHNVLTKIRCTPGSVLSPDNRRWLDSQGEKSPEVTRRLILGQQSFTFGNDGDLIESPSSSLTDKCSNNDRSATEDKKCPAFTSEPIWENSSDKTDTSNNSNNNINASSDGKGKPEQNNLIHDKPPPLPPGPLDILEDTSQNGYFKILTTEHKEHVLPNEFQKSEIKSKILEFGKQDENFENLQKDLSSNRIENSIKTDGGTSLSNMAPISLKDELRDSGVHLTYNGPASETEYSVDDNFYNERKGSFRPILSRTESGSVDYSSNESEISEKNEYLVGSATESEFGTSHAATITAINRHYDDLVQLRQTLKGAGFEINIGSKEQFSSISEDQRSTLQKKTVSEALNVYLNQLTDDDMHFELKTCLSTEAQKVADLFDVGCDSSKLSVVVRQMNALLQHQTDLSAEIKRLTAVENKPSACHDMCDHILKRVQELEQIVQQNADELAKMKFKLQNKRNDSNDDGKTSQ